MATISFLLLQLLVLGTVLATGPFYWHHHRHPDRGWIPGSSGGDGSRFWHGGSHHGLPHMNVLHHGGGHHNGPHHSGPHHPMHSISPYRYPSYQAIHPPPHVEGHPVGSPSSPGSIYISGPPSAHPSGGDAVVTNSPIAPSPATPEMVRPIQEVMPELLQPESHLMQQPEPLPHLMQQPEPLPHQSSSVPSQPQASSEGFIRTNTLPGLFLDETPDVMRQIEERVYNISRNDMPPPTPMRAPPSLSSSGSSSLPTAGASEEQPTPESREWTPVTETAPASPMLIGDESQTNAPFFTTNVNVNGESVELPRGASPDPSATDEGRTGSNRHVTRSVIYDSSTPSRGLRSTRPVTVSSRAPMVDRSIDDRSPRAETTGLRDISPLFQDRDRSGSGLGGTSIGSSSARQPHPWIRVGGPSDVGGYSSPSSSSSTSSSDERPHSASVPYERYPSYSSNRN